MFLNYFVIGFISTFALLILSLMANGNYTIDKKIKKSIIYACIFTAIIIISEVVVAYFEIVVKQFNFTYLLLNLIGFLFSPVIAVLVANTITTQKNNYSMILLIPLAFNFVLTVLSPSFGFIFNITNHGIYLRGNYFWVYVLACISSMLYLFISIYLIIRRYPDKSKYILIAIVFFLATCVSIQISNSSLHISWLCVTISLIFLYAYFCELSQKKDALTNLFNRRAYEKSIKTLEEIDRATIYMFDVDDFKQINDDYGHEYGDKYLVFIANTIEDVFSHIGCCFRIGGDEFCVIAKPQNEKSVQRHIDEFENRLQLLSVDKLPSVSIGCVSYNKKKNTIDNVLNEADKRMYDYKKINKAKFNDNY